jgi:carbamoyl-phosphate synthase large subunit
MISSEESVVTCGDKLRFASTLQSIPEVVPAFEAIGEGARDKRWVVKERWGAGSRHILLDLSGEEAALRSREFASPVFQPFIEGREYSIDLYRSLSRQVWGCVVRSRDRVVSGESQVSTVVRHERLEKLCCQAVEVLDLTGHAVFQAIEDGHGELHLIECNPRFGGASTLAVAAGLNSFGWFFRETLNEGFAPPAFVRGTPGLKLTRYPVDRIDLSAGGGT